MDYSEFVKKLKDIEKMGFIKSHRKGSTGIGKTLEDLLGIAENNIPGPDFSKHELKSARKNSSSMLTLFTKAPLQKGANNQLLEKCGYQQRKVPIDYQQFDSFLGTKKEGENNIPLYEKELHSTVDAIKPNAQNLILRIVGNKLIIGNDKDVDAYYENNILKETFEKKYNKLVYVLAENKKEKGEEFFWFNEAYHLDGFSFERFSTLVDEGLLKVDLRMGHYSNGRPHDHGTGFRIMPRYLPRCFEKIETIL